MKMNKQPTQKKRKKHLLFAYLGVVIGILLLCSPFLFSWYTAKQKAPVRVLYEKRLKTTDASVFKKAKAYNEKIFEEQQTIGGAKGKEYIKDVLGENLKVPIGFIDIPSIHLKNMAIYYGDSDWVLNRGVGNMDWTSLPTGGTNTMASLTGHSGLANQIYFDNIRHLKKGDIVFVDSFGKTKSYQLTGETKVIDPNKKESVQNFFVRKGQDTIVLMTCTPIFINSHRLLVYAKRVPYQKAVKIKHITRDFWSIDHLFLFIILFFLFLLFLFILYQTIHQKKNKKKN